MWRLWLSPLVTWEAFGDNKQGSDVIWLAWSNISGELSYMGGWMDTPNLPESCHSEWKHLQWTEKAVAFVEIMCLANRCWNKPIRKNKNWGSHQRPVPGLRIITAAVELVVVVLEAALAWDPQNGMSQLLLINLFINTSPYTGEHWTTWGVPGTNALIQYLQHFWGNFT